jgi:hypothetical protein
VTGTHLISWLLLIIGIGKRELKVLWDQEVLFRMPRGLWRLHPIPNLRELNICLLGSWITRYAFDKDKIWKLLVDFKYNTNSTNIFTCRSYGDSNFWKGVLWASQVAKIGYRWRIRNGKHVRF